MLMNTHLLLIHFRINTFSLYSLQAAGKGFEGGRWGKRVRKGGGGETDRGLEGGWDYKTSGRTILGIIKLEGDGRVGGGLGS